MLLTAVFVKTFIKRLCRLELCLGALTLLVRQQEGHPACDEVA